MWLGVKNILFLGAFLSRPKIPEIPGRGANGTDIFLNFIPKFWVYLARLAKNSGKSAENPAHSTIPTRASFSEPGNRTTWRELLVESVCQLQTLSILQRKAKTCFEGRMAARPDPFPSGIPGVVSFWWA